MSKQLSSRVQGLKFMQRGNSSPQKPAEPLNTETEDLETRGNDQGNDAKSQEASQEQWVIPAEKRVQVQPQVATSSAANWNSWFIAALEDKRELRRRPSRRSFGHWSHPTERQAKSEDEFSGMEDNQDCESGESGISEEDDIDSAAYNQSRNSSTPSHQNTGNKSRIRKRQTLQTSSNKSNAGSTPSSFQKPPSAFDSKPETNRKRSADTQDKHKKKFATIASSSEGLRKQRKHPT
ncbi:hypothetical protein MYAM1_002065 [Malassezia yamatoensis]|uniref:Uncharacterized protein n=1 Tax=Malassezia yamatoensis TaxID=253288 RepID=A0AAJ5YV79_9BASI|nr:hypothetical protein MYAM1_002065 [Malassezia yamatoensis]